MISHRTTEFTVCCSPWACFHSVSGCSRIGYRTDAFGARFPPGETARNRPSCQAPEDGYQMYALDGPAVSRLLRGKVRKSPARRWPLKKDGVRHRPRDGQGPIRRNFAVVNSSPVICRSQPAARRNNRGRPANRRKIFIRHRPGGRETGSQRLNLSQAPYPRNRAPNPVGEADGSCRTYPGSFCRAPRTERAFSTRVTGPRGARRNPLADCAPHIPALWSGSLRTRPGAAHDQTSVGNT